MHSHLTEEPRRIPRQQRGERRVAQLLEAAAVVIADAGYEGATMSAIAERAGAPIGSLYQFFPSKEAITHALRTEYGKDYEALLMALGEHAKHLSLQALVGRLIGLSIRFVESHPAFLPLLDAPLSTSPLSLRATLRVRLADCLSAVDPDLARNKSLRLAAVTLQMLKGLTQLYAEVAPREGGDYVREYKLVLCGYLTARLVQGHREEKQ